MQRIHHLLPVLVLVTGLGASAVRADTVSSPPTAASPGTTTYGHRHHGGFGAVLRKLDLSADQQVQVKAILAQEKPRISALRESFHANRQALASTPPGDPGYPALFATAQSNAAARIQLASDVRTQIYAVLTPAQQAAIPGLLAAAQSERAARVAAWKARRAAT